MFSNRMRKVGVVVIAIALGVGTAAAALGGCSADPAPPAAVNGR